MLLSAARWRTFPSWSCVHSFRVVALGKRLFTVGAAPLRAPTLRLESAAVLIAIANFWTASALWRRSMPGVIGCAPGRMGRTSKEGWSAACVALVLHEVARNAFGMGSVVAWRLA